mmetsp:Transcript_9138/g.30106  ORF Transcript_9138/g.30106 Transcript_9138/m.30106 type:complete len:235 (-) Transcript_9138:114-818(-)
MASTTGASGALASLETTRSSGISSTETNSSSIEAHISGTDGGSSMFVDEGGGGGGGGGGGVIGAATAGTARANGGGGATACLRSTATGGGGGAAHDRTSVGAFPRLSAWRKSNARHSAKSFLAARSSSRTTTPPFALTTLGCSSKCSSMAKNVLAALNASTCFIVTACAPPARSTRSARSYTAYAKLLHCSKSSSSSPSGVDRFVRSSVFSTASIAATGRGASVMPTSTARNRQ